MSCHCRLHLRWRPFLPEKFIPAASLSPHLQRMRYQPALHTARQERLQGFEMQHPAPAPGGAGRGGRHVCRHADPGVRGARGNDKEGSVRGCTMAPRSTRGKKVQHKACKECGTVAEPTVKTPGSIGIELILWLCFFVPGLIYSLWRRSKRHDVCAACGSTRIVPASSPDGAKIGAALPPAAQVSAQPARSPSAGAVGAGRVLGRLARRLMG